MSTDILKYEDGKRRFELKGLKTYIMIALPMTALTFFAWYVIYCLARRRERLATTASEGEFCQSPA